MKNKKLNRILTILMICMFIGVQLFTGVNTNIVKAATNFNVEVQVNGIDKVITYGKSSKSNALDALKDVLNKNKVSNTIGNGSYGSYVKEIGGLSEKKFGGYDGWLVAIKNSTSYNLASNSIDKTKLNNGDKLIVFYGDFYSTSILNDLKFSTSYANKELNIALNYKYTNWDKDGNPFEDTKPIKGIKVKLDGKVITLTENNIYLPNGLKDGSHNIEVYDWNNSSYPKIVNDKYYFTIKPTSNSLNVNSSFSALLKYSSKNYSDTWTSMSLRGTGYSSSSKFILDESKYIKKYGSKCIKKYSNTELEKLILGLVASGYTPYSFCGNNLVAELFNRDINKFYINDLVFGLIVYNYGNITGTYKISKSILANKLLSKRLNYTTTEGNKITGWSLIGDTIDADMTGIALAALSTYYYTGSANVKNILNSVVNSLSVMQNSNGSISGKYGISSETISYVILGLTSVGVNPEGSKFTKNNKDLVSALMTFRLSNGLFKHSSNETSTNTISNNEALMALTALKHYTSSFRYSFFTSSIKASTLKKYNK